MSYNCIVPEDSVFLLASVEGPKDEHETLKLGYQLC